MNIKLAPLARYITYATLRLEVQVTKEVEGFGGEAQLRMAWNEGTTIV